MRMDPHDDRAEQPKLASLSVQITGHSCLQGNAFITMWWQADAARRERLMSTVAVLIAICTPCFLWGSDGACVPRFCRWGRNVEKQANLQTLMQIGILRTMVEKQTDAEGPAILKKGWDQWEEET